MRGSAALILIHFFLIIFLQLSIMNLSVLQEFNAELVYCTLFTICSPEQEPNICSETAIICLHSKNDDNHN